MTQRADRSAGNPPLREDDARARRVRAWLGQHLYCALSSLGRLSGRPGATALTVLAMGLALALPLLVLLLVDSLGALGGMVSDSREISAFLMPGATAGQVADAAAAARSLPDASGVAVRDPAQGLDELRAISGFGPAIEAIGENPLPHVLVVSPGADASAAHVGALADALGALPGVAHVQFDLEWRERLDAVLAVGRRLAWVFGALLALGAVLVVGNTIRLDVAARADEIAIVQLLGGSDGFVRRPFVYTGIWYGVLSATIALAGTWAAVLFLGGPLARLAAAYSGVLALRGPGVTAHLAMFGFGIVVGWSGAWVTVRRRLALGRAR